MRLGASHFCRLSLAAAVLFTACQKDTRPRDAAWTDPPNDILPFPGEPGWVQPDVISARASARKGHIQLGVEMPFSIKDYYGQLSEKGYRRGQLLAAFYIDSDNNIETGHHPLNRPELRGFEYVVRLSLGFWAKSKETGLVRTGRVTFDPKTFVYKRIPTVELLRLHADYLEPLRPGIHIGVKSFDDLTTISGGHMEVRIPYKMFELKSGDAIRIILHEAAAGPAAAAYSDDKVIALE